MRDGQIYCTEKKDRVQEYTRWLTVVVVVIVQSDRYKRSCRLNEAGVAQSGMRTSSRLYSTGCGGTIDGVETFDSQSGCVTRCVQECGPLSSTFVAGRSNIPREHDYQRENNKNYTYNESYSIVVCRISALYEGTATRFFAPTDGSRVIIVDRHCSVFGCAFVVNRYSRRPLNLPIVLAAYVIAGGHFC